MKIALRTATLAALIIAATGTCYAVLPAYEGQFGNPEEPALRPYKAFWAGLRAIAHRSKESLIEGNMKVPILGTIQTVQGFRRGVVDCAEYTYCSMQGSLPPRGDEYKEPGTANEHIEEEPLFRNTADLLAGCWIFGAATGEECLVRGISSLAAQKAVDEYPATTLKERETLKHDIKLTRQERADRKAAEKPVNPDPRDTPVKVAQRHYLGERAVDNRSPRGTGNLLKLLD